MFRLKEFQRSLLPLIIANSIVSTGLLEYFVNQIICMIGFIYIICCLVYYISLFNTFKNTLDIIKSAQTTNIAKIISALTFIENPLLYIITIFIGLIRRKQVKLFVKQLENCTRRIDELNIPKNYSSLLRYQCIVGIFAIFLTLGLIIDDIYWYFDIDLSFNYSLMLQFYYYDNYAFIVMMIVNFTFVFWIRQVNQFIFYKK
ncbi:gustatory receptor for sugar taste 43a-like [Vespula maculifrons]|uniref:Gustatory receptor for sugar taste 43a-like n=1 Tax=Vespula maculifrons TaxID=7453 RepID=A0ABD2CNZ6_VESMC